MALFSLYFCCSTSVLHGRHYVKKTKQNKKKNLFIFFLFAKHEILMLVFFSVYLEQSIQQMISVMIRANNCDIIYCNI